MGAVSTPKPRIAWFSPLGDAWKLSDSPSAYLTRSLVPTLRTWCDVTVVSDRDDDSGDVPVVHFLRAFDLDRKNPFDLWVYQLENSKATWFCRMQLALQPGVVIFHDLLLSDYGPDPMTSTPSNELLAGFLSEEQTFPSLDTFWKPEGPYAYREAAYAPVKVFMSRKDIAEWRRTIAPRPALGSTAWFLPYPVRSTARRASGPSTSHPLRVGFVGSPGIEQRAHVVLEALRGSAVHTELVWMIDPSERSAAEALIKEFDVESARLIVGRSPEAWQQLLSEIDVALHLHFSVFGGPGPYLPVSIHTGVPVVLSEFGDALTLPRDFFLYVQPGETEVFELREVLTRISELSSEARHELRDKLQGYGREMYSSDSVGRELRLVIEQSISELGPFMNRWRSYREKARATLLSRQSFRESASLPGSASISWYESPLATAFHELGWTIVTREVDR